MTDAARDPIDLPHSAATVRLPGGKWGALETARNRLLATGLVFLLAFGVMVVRVVDLAVLDDRSRVAAAGQPPAMIRRGDIVDRNGTVLATSLPTPSLYADPKEVIDASAAAAAIVSVLPDLNRQELLAKLSSEKRFVWLRRNLTPSEQERIHNLGIPGLAFWPETRRFYPRGRAAAHILGLTDIDGRGIAGVEQSLNGMLSHGEPARLSLDIRVQHVLRQELEATVREFRAVGAAGIVLDARTAEVVAMVSLPDFSPNTPMEDPAESRFNRVTSGVYEMGSVFKLFTVAMALDSGTATLRSGYDASRPIHISRFTISDYHPENRWLSVPEILIHSSNIGSAHMAVDVGTSRMRAYLGKLNMLGAARIELPEVGEALAPSPWRDINTMTVGFGHGLAVTPLQLSAAVAAVVNGGVMRPPTLLARDGRPAEGTVVLSEQTSRTMRALMRLVVTHGTGTRADVAGFQVGGKTGTAEKLINGHYQRNKRMSSFVGAFPMSDPRYVVLATIDEPIGNRSTYNYATGGWVAAPCIGRLVSRIAPLLGVPPDAVEMTQRKMTDAERDRGRALAIREAVAQIEVRRVATH